ncbi:MAG TPA: helix-turn-helix transcriptional regulator [Candidatus Acidoferrum sp.]
MDVCFVIQQRLKELGLEQRDLAAAAQVTESYISQLLTRKKSPPADDRTDLYDRMDAFLKLPEGQLAAMVRDQRREELKKKFADPPAPLIKEVRELVIRKCAYATRVQIRDIFEKQAFGELERLVTQKLLDVVKGIARDELKNETWVRRVAKLRRQSYEEMRANILEFLDTDVFNVSVDHCTAFLDPVIESWDIDLKSFALEILLSDQFAAKRHIMFEFTQTATNSSSKAEPGLREFLRNPAMSGTATETEIQFLKNLRLPQARPSALYYYRELQSLRDPLHFAQQQRIPSTASRKKRSHSDGALSPGSIFTAKNHRKPQKRSK